ncbi:MAG: hypothetical protein A2725_01155 [Candidatus Magasanikbacteria bacterium RIFCSPHIGHO2_01_FULL_33_34]|uniref:Glycosyltransferase RgtA/B/C/D-like domain-containing protein n=1 Tax=Candidatus Magasanikbacteria bacterium RIFCSPHIGHO2_01_FULL_33_34 TaxID=1798671 RepID=A0A1F6LJA7_9BACT|nr:MAG: hypothetical protein A2725_01155 [Candidatus Magasanikbacteria bacterium RIFCSPHIGHO2_01_FULL_33_34]OGH65363.1 MAG: hypothetical protein A3B83_04815 [Candidatus Magasanikbacteria bacterium RIFCSPHIGHO2_02_FULL_33_17]OGH76139.1 MAG: hypothetical protein A3A89_01735 [Candidatus Magasanikbacteria bacterium RIFCSPLOWO2_01_FULL_33_34]
MIKLIKKYNIEIILFLLAFSIRAIYAIVIQRMFGEDVFVSYSDTTVYVKLANNILYNNIFSEALVHPELVPDAMRTPGYPLFLLPFRLFSTPYITIVMVQNILAGIVSVLIYKIALLLFNNKYVGIISSVIFSFDPTMIYWSNLLMSDHFAGVFFAFFVLFFIKKKYGLAGLMIGITAQVRPIFLYLFPIVIITLLYMHKDSVKNFLRTKKIKKQPFIKPVVLVVFFFCLVLFPWMARNYKQFGHFSLSSNGWMAIHIYISEPFAKLHNIPHYWLEPPPDYYQFPGSDNMRRPNKYTYYHYEYNNHPFYKEYLRDLITRHPIDFIRFHLTGAFKGFFKADYGYLADHVLLPKKPDFPQYVLKPVVAFLFIFWYGLVLLALSTLMIKKYRLWTSFLLSFLALNVLLTGNIANGSNSGRYNMPFFPFVVMLGVFGAWEIYCKYIRNKKVCTQKNILKKD